jgi:hypothetical protein
MGTNGGRKTAAEMMTLACPTCGGAWAHPACPICHLPFSDWPPGRSPTALYCTVACKNVANQRAYKRRKAAAT